LIATGEQSGLRTRIAATEGVSLCVRIEKLPKATLPLTEDTVAAVARPMFLEQPFAKSEQTATQTALIQYRISGIS
jgi:hypothetical protein